MGLYNPQDDNGLGASAPPPYDPNAPVVDATAPTDQFTNLVAQTEWARWSNYSPAAMAAPCGLIDAWWSVHDALVASRTAKGQINSIADKLEGLQGTDKPIPAALRATVALMREQNRDLTQERDRLLTLAERLALALPKPVAESTHETPATPPTVMEMPSPGSAGQGAPPAEMSAVPRSSGRL